MSSKSLLSISNLTVEFGGLRALDDVFLTLESNQVVGLIGPNGAGKTTLFNAICGLVKPTSGTLALNGEAHDWPATHDLTSLGISDVNREAADVVSGIGCGGKTFDIQLFYLDPVDNETKAYDCTALHLNGDASYLDGTIKTTTTSCADSKISFTIPIGTSAGSWAFDIPFNGGPSSINYFTLVSRA